MEENNTSENKEEKKKLAGSNPGPGPTYKAMELAKPERKGRCAVLAWYGSNGKIFPFNKFLRWCACGLDKMLRRGLSP